MARNLLAGNSQMRNELKPPIRVEKVLLSSLKLDSRNARRHSERNVDAVVESLKAHGQVEPLVVRTKNRQIIGGECRYLAMRNPLKWTHAYVVFLDISVEDAKSLAIRLNRTAELAEWNNEFLAENIRDLLNKKYDIDTLGWNPQEIKSILEFNEIKNGFSEIPDLQTLGNSQSHVCPKCGHKF
jgi:ParB-like chromosome segregation protein Spo0J